MGSCHTVPAILSIQEPERCMLCWQSIPVNITNCVKCVQCNIRFHPSCVAEYQQKYKSDPLHCPHCKRVGTFYMYEDGVYSCG